MVLGVLRDAEKLARMPPVAIRSGSKDMVGLEPGVGKVTAKAGVLVYGTQQVGKHDFAGWRSSALVVEDVMERE